MELIVSLLLAVLLILVFTTAVAAVALLVFMRRLAARNKVAPGSPVSPPVSWLAHPSAPARLHRRLRTAAAGARAAIAVAPGEGRLQELTAELEQEAIALDQAIVAASFLPAAERKARLAALAADVLRVEQAASQVSLLAAQGQAAVQPAGQPSALDHLAAQLDALEAARREITDIEAAAGLHKASPWANPPASETPRQQPG